MIIFFIRKIPDLDNITPIIYKFAKETNDKVYIIKTDFSDKFVEDFRINFLLKNDKISFLNINELFIFSFLQKILYNIVFRKNLLCKLLNFIFFISYFYKKIFNIFFKEIKINSIFLVKKTVVIDHLLFSKLYFLNYFILNERNNINLISIPHGIPLLKKHNKEWNIAKKDLSILSHKVDKIVIQHKWWLKELKEYKINNNYFLIGSARFERNWILKYLQILPKDKIEKTNKIKIVYMSANSINHIDYDYLKEETIKYLASNNKIILKYKPHPRTNKLYRSLPNNVENVYKVNSLNLIKWADIIIGDISSIMIDVLIMNKLYISLKYLRHDNNELLYEYYNSCTKFDKIESFKKYINNIPNNKIDNYFSNEINKYSDGKKEFLKDVVFNNSNNVVKEYLDLIQNQNK